MHDGVNAGPVAARRWVNRPEGSTWGDFGADDQVGRLNLLTPDVVLKGVAEVREGRTFCLSMPLDLPGGNAVNPKRLPPVLRPTKQEGEDYYNYVWADHSLPGSRDLSADDLVILHTQYSTQWDSLAHFGQLFDADGDGVEEAVYYNGWRAGNDVPHADPIGTVKANRLGIENMAETGVQGRGVLVDLEAHVGRERRAVGYDGLMAALESQKVSVEEGDMLLLHTGWDDMIFEMAGAPDAALLHKSCAVLDGWDARLLQWITDSGIAALISDNMAVEDTHYPSKPEDDNCRIPLHRHCLFKLGVHLGEIWYLSELKRALRERGRWRFLLTAPPLRLPGAVGSPVTPIATI